MPIMVENADIPVVFFVDLYRTRMGLQRILKHGIARAVQHRYIDNKEQCRDKSEYKKW